MKKFFVSALGSALAVVAVAQQRSPITPPAIPDFTPARPQPGIVTGASGGIGAPAFPGPPPGIAREVPRNARGRSVFTPFPVVVVPNTDFIGPEPFDPLAAEGQPFPPLDLPFDAGTLLGRPGGLGVTITGGSTNPPAVTNPPTPTNSTGGNVTNSTDR